MIYKKPKEFYKLNDDQKRYFFAGVPISFMRFETPYEFQSVTVSDFDGKNMKEVEIFALEQEERYKNLMDYDYFSDDLFIVISSSPTNYIAMGLGAQLAMKAIDLKYDVSFWNAADSAYNIDDNKNVIFIYNVFSSSTIERIQNARDILYKKKGRFRVLLLGGDLDPVKFIQTHLHMATNVVLYTTSPVVKKVLWR